MATGCLRKNCTVRKRKFRGILCNVKMKKEKEKTCNNTFIGLLLVEYFNNPPRNTITNTTTTTDLIKFSSFFLEQNGGKLFLNYNLGAKDITLGDLNTKVNDGRYHVVRFTRSDTNSSMQVDDNPVHTKFPQGIFTKKNNDIFLYQNWQ